jgi:hypothetical protein
MLFDQDLKTWQEDSDKAKLAARARQIAPLAASNPGEFKKQYIVLKSIDMGGPDSMAGLEAASAGAKKAQAAAKDRQEQDAFEQHTLKVELRRRLQDFITLARSVDFSAQVRPNGGKNYFINSAYEAKPDAWKKLYRLGKEPTRAMVAVAEQWLKEL